MSPLGSLIIRLKIPATRYCFGPRQVRQLDGFARGTPSRLAHLAQAISPFLQTRQNLSRNRSAHTALAVPITRRDADDQARQRPDEIVDLPSRDTLRTVGRRRSLNRTWNRKAGRSR